jgi:hypothetical protein
MINALLLLWAVGQDADVAVTGSGRRTGGEYELKISGAGRSLKDQESVSLRFRRLANRIDWTEGSIRTVAVDDEISRTTAVDRNAFVHQERFATPGEVEVVIGSDDRPIRRTFRLSTLPEEANAIVAAAKRFDSALRGLRLMVDDIDATKDEMCPVGRKQAQLQKRIDWRRKAYREEIAESFLTASADALGRLMADIESAVELERVGKDVTSLMFSLTAESFCWDEARVLIGEIESVSLRERGLLAVRALGVLAHEAAEKVRSGNTVGWTRAEKEFSRTIETLFEADQAARTGVAGADYAARVDGDGVTLEALLNQARELVKAGAASIGGAMADDGCFADQTKALQDRLASFEQRLRASK